MTVVAGVFSDHVQVDPPQGDFAAHERTGSLRIQTGAVGPRTGHLVLPGRFGVLERGVGGEVEPAVTIVGIGLRVVDRRGVPPPPPPARVGWLKQAAGGAPALPGGGVPPGGAALGGGGGAEAGGAPGGGGRPGGGRESERGGGTGGGGGEGQPASRRK